MFKFTLLILCLMSGYSDWWIRSIAAQNMSLDQPPITTAAYLNSFAHFFCYVRLSSSRLFFNINSTSVPSLPESYDASSFSGHALDGVGTNLTLRIRALRETNNSMIVCGVDTTGRIDFEYFPSPALLLVQGVPPPPTDLNEQLNRESSSLVLTWQPPRGLIIEDGITFLISINITDAKNLTYHYENETKGLNYTQYFVEDYDSFIDICILYYLFVSITPVNKVGKGEELYKVVDVKSLCPTTTIVNEPLAATTTMTTTTICSLGGGEVLNSCKEGTIQFRTIYVAAGTASGLLILVLIVVVIIGIILCWKQLVKAKARISGRRNIPHLQLATKPNEAYVCAITLKENSAYQGKREFCGEKIPTREPASIVLENNEAYQPVVKKQVIYEEILPIDAHVP